MKIFIALIIIAARDYLNGHADAAPCRAQCAEFLHPRRITPAAPSE